MVVAVVLASLAGLAALALVMITLGDISKLLEDIANLALAQHEVIMDKLDVQPPLADEKPQAVQVTIIPSRQGASAWMDFEASQKAALDEFKEN